MADEDPEVKGKSSTEDEFFKHLNLSKSSDFAKNGPLRSPAYPMTRNKSHVKAGCKRQVRDEADDTIGQCAKFTKHESAATLAFDTSRPKKVGADYSSKKQSGDGSGSKRGIRKTEISENSSSSNARTKTNSEFDFLKCEIRKGTNEDILKKEDMLKKEMKSPPYQCLAKTCSKAFDKWERFIRHLRQHQSSFPYTCTQCDSKFRCRGDLVSHLKRHFGMRSIRCEVCGEQFEKKRSLLSHMVAKHGDKDQRPRNFKCTECAQAFLSKSAVDRHMSCHTGYKPEVCSYCNASFHTEYDLKDHLRIHSGEKPFKCDQCDFCARTSQLLNKHKKSHSKDKPFHCKKCDFSCNSSQSLKRHGLLHSGKLPYKCPYCDHRCRDMDNMKKHIRKVKKHKGLKIYPCTKCPFSTDEGPAFLEHMKELHYPYLDLRTTKAAKLSGILTEDASLPDEVSGGASSNNLFQDPTYSFLNSCEIPDGPHLCGIEQSSIATDQYNGNTETPFDKVNASESNCSTISTVNSCNKGDILLSSVASNNSEGTRKEGAFPSGTFDINSCWVPPLCNTTDANVDGLTTNEACNTVITKRGVETHQGYIAVLVEWPAGQTIELQHGNLEGSVTVPSTEADSLKLDA